MIVLDTNVVSETLKPKPSLKVLEWLDNQAVETLYITTVTRAELRYGVLKLPDGKRKEALSALIDRALGVFEGRTLSFDAAAADQMAILAAHSDKIGRRAIAPDAYIAACAAAHGFAVATRNVSHFEHTGVRVINPWE